MHYLVDLCLCIESCNHVVFLLFILLVEPQEAGKSSGATTWAARINDRANSAMMMVQFTTLFQRLFTYFPSNSWSFKSSCRKMIAEGSMTPASTCTPTI